MNLNYPKTSRFVSWRRNVISSIYVSYHMARLYNLYFISWMVDCSCCCCCYKYRSTHSSNQNLWRTMSRFITWKNPDDLETLWGCCLHLCQETVANPGNRESWWAKWGIQQPEEEAKRSILHNICRSPKESGKGHEDGMRKMGSKDSVAP